MDGDAEDEAPNALKGYLEGGATATTDRNGNEGKALLFDGVDDKVTVNHNELLYSEALTVSAWIKAPAQNTGGGVIVGKHGGGNTNQRSWLMSTSSVGPNDRLQVVVSESADNSKLKLYYSSIGILDNTWHHVAFTFADNELKFYIDGVEDLGVTKFKDDVVNFPNNSTADLTIGWRIQDDAESNFFKGTIDEVGIFDRVFSAADIAALADDTNPLEISREERMVAGRGLNNYDYGFRIYNPAVGKFLSVDPLTKSYPMLTPYQFASNRPIDGIDLDGLEYFPNGGIIVEQTARTLIKKIGDEETLHQYNVSMMKVNNAILIGSAIPAAAALDIYLTKGAITKEIINQVKIQIIANAAPEMYNVAKGKQNVSAAFENTLKNTLKGVDGADAIIAVVIKNKTVSNVLASMLDISLNPETGEPEFKMIEGEFFTGSKEYEKSTVDVIIDAVFNSVTDKLGNKVSNTKFSGPVNKAFEAAGVDLNQLLKDFFIEINEKSRARKDFDINDMKNPKVEKDNTTYFIREPRYKKD